MIFHETLGLITYCQSLFSGKVCFYYRKTLIVLFVEHVIGSIKRLSPKISQIKPFGWGDTVYIGQAVRSASDNAIRYSETIFQKHSSFLKKSANLFNINFPLIFKKYVLVRILYPKYFFYELVLQYISENKGEEHQVVVDATHISMYDKLLQNCSVVGYKRQYLMIEVVLSFLMIPLLLLIYWRMKILADAPTFENRLICILDMPQMHGCYQEVFEAYSNVNYAITEEYKNFFSQKQIEEMDISCLGLTRATYMNLKKGLYDYWRLVFFHMWSLRPFGMHLLKLFNEIIKGRIKAPSGIKNVLISSEHHDLSKTIRNEFIKSEGSKSVLFSYNSLFVLQFYPEEFYENYDCVCLPGEHYRDDLENNGAAVNHFLKLGSYVYHKIGLRHAMPPDKSGILTSFEGQSLNITILCPGVCKPTYHSEKKLMELAQQLSEKTDARIFIRQKPFEPEEQYKGFYENYVAGRESMLLTGTEYQLFDFLPVTDLFITTYSTSACEVAMCGGKVYFVDFINQRDRFVFWKPETIGSLLLDGKDALQRITAWVNDRPGGLIRTRHNQDMECFVNYISYRYDTYEDYRSNLDNQLREHVFQKGWGTLTC